MASKRLTTKRVKQPEVEQHQTEQLNSTFSIDDGARTEQILRELATETETAELQQDLHMILPESDPLIDLRRLKGIVTVESDDGTFNIRPSLTMDRLAKELREMLSMRNDLYRSVKNIIFTFIFYIKGPKFYLKFKEMSMSTPCEALTSETVKDLEISVFTARNMYGLVDTERLVRNVQAIRRWYNSHRK